LDPQVFILYPEWVPVDFCFLTSLTFVYYFEARIYIFKYLLGDMALVGQFKDRFTRTSLKRDFCAEFQQRFVVSRVYVGFEDGRIFMRKYRHGIENDFDNVILAERRHHSPVTLDLRGSLLDSRRIQKMIEQCRLPLVGLVLDGLVVLKEAVTAAMLIHKGLEVLSLRGCKKLGMILAHLKLDFPDRIPLRVLDVGVSNEPDFFMFAEDGVVLSQPAQDGYHVPRSGTIYFKDVSGLQWRYFLPRGQTDIQAFYRRGAAERYLYQTSPFRQLLITVLLCGQGVPFQVWYQVFSFLRAERIELEIAAGFDFDLEA